MNTIQTLHIITEPTRFRLLQYLFAYHYCVKALSKELGISEPAVSQHIRILKEYGIVHGVKIGYQVHYRVDREKVISLFEGVAQQFSEYPPETELSRNCSCECISECLRRDAKALEAQKNGK